MARRAQARKATRGRGRYIAAACGELSRRCRPPAVAGGGESGARAARNVAASRARDAPLAALMVWKHGVAPLQMHGCGRSEGGMSCERRKTEGGRDGGTKGQREGACVCVCERERDRGEGEGIEGESSSVITGSDIISMLFSLLLFLFDFFT